MSSARVCLCYVNLGPREDAHAVARILVDERLAAAVNVQSGVHSVYRWQGTVVEAPEVVLIAKTRTALIPQLTARVLALHSYQCPAVVAVPACGGNPAYLAWVEEQTS